MQHLYDASSLRCNLTLLFSAVLLVLMVVPAEAFAQDRVQAFSDIQRLSNTTAQTPRRAQTQPSVYKVQALTFYTNRATFDADFPGLPTEDFEESPVTFVSACDEPFDENTNQPGCYAPGDILPGLEVWTLEKIRTGCAFEDCPLVVLDPGVIGTPSKVVGANFFSDNTELQFTDPSITAVGLDVFAGNGDETAAQVNATINVYGPSGLLGSTTVDANPSGAFIGAFSDSEPIERIEVLTDGAGEVVDNVTFGAGTTEADLAVEKVCDAGNNDASFHVSVYNDGPGDATGVWVQDNLPGAILVTGWSTSQGTFDPFSGAWDVGDLAVGATADLWIDVDLQGEGRYTNHAEVSALNEDDPDPYNDYDECSFVKTGDRVVPDFVPGQSAGAIVERGNRFSADLALTKDVNRETAPAGSQVIYTIMVENLGPQSTAKVEITDQIPACLTFVSASADKGSFNETTGVWSVGEMKVGAKVTLELVASVSDDCSGTVTNTAYVSSSSLPDPSDFFNLFDEPPATANNMASASFGVDGRELVLDGTTFALGTNYPNPFNPTTRIPFSLAESGQVSVRVYDLLGREVSVLVDGSLSAGVHEVEFEGSALPTGMYIVRMEAAGVVKTMRMTLMK